MKYDPYLEDFVYDPNDKFTVDASVSVSFDFTTLEKHEDTYEETLNEIVDGLNECITDFLHDYQGGIETYGYMIDDIKIINY